MNERKTAVEEGLSKIQECYDRIGKEADRTLKAAMPSQGDSFPKQGMAKDSRLNRNLGGKFFGELTRLIRVYKEEKQYKVELRLFTCDWTELPFYDKFEVLLWMRDQLESSQPTDSDSRNTCRTLEAGISHIEDCFSEISDLSDKLINAILPNPGDCLKINEGAKAEDALCLNRGECEHPEPLEQICRSADGETWFLHTTKSVHDWHTLLALEKSLLLTRQLSPPLLPASASNLSR